MHCLYLNLLGILEKYNYKSYICVFYKNWSNFSKRTLGQPILSLIQVFQKILEKEIKHEFLMEIYKESLRGQYRSDCTIFWWLMKNLWKDNMDWTILSFIYLLYPGFYKIRYIARFKGRHSSGADNTVHSVQMDNLVHKDNTSWNKINLLIFV